MNCLNSFILTVDHLTCYRDITTLVADMAVVAPVEAKKNEASWVRTLIRRPPVPHRMSPAGTISIFHIRQLPANGRLGGI